MGCKEICPGSTNETAATRCSTGIVLDDLTRQIFDLQQLIGGELDELAQAEIKSVSIALKAVIDQCPFRQRFFEAIETDTGDPNPENQRGRARLNLNIRPREVMAMAASAGMSIQSGGRHLMIVTADGSSSFALPNHPGTLSRGVAYSALRWFQAQKSS